MDINTHVETGITMPAQPLKAERIKVLYKQAYSVLMGNILIASLLGFGLYKFTNNLLALYWLITVIIFTAFRYLMVKKYYKSETEYSEQIVIKWGYFFALTTFISGCMWGATSFLFLQTDNIVIMLFLLMTLTGITVGSSASLANFALSYYTFAIPTLLPFAYVLSSTGKTEYIVLSAMLTVFLILQLVIARKNQSTLDESIILRNENTDLIQQLKIKKDKAESANAAKTRFLAAASHDLRQPLHAMGLFLDILDEHNQDSEQAMIVDKIKKSSLSLENLLESLLDISKLDAGVINVNKNSFSIQKLFDVLENEFNSIADEKQLNIHFMPTTLCANSDVHLIDRILRNLISNAIRYTEHGKVLIGCRRKEESILLSVYDTGIGIDQHKIEIIFEEFHQLDNPGRDRSKGLGLGLSIVNRLADLLNAKLSILSTPGKGSVFSIELPLSSSSQIAQTNSVTLETNSILTDKTIVIIEDEKEIRDALTLLLSGWGCKVLELTSVKDVKQKLQLSYKPDIILADYRLQEHETGVNVIHAIYDYYQDNTIPAVIITGDTAPNRIKEAKESGFQLLHKPVSGGKLRAILNSILS